MYGSVFVYNFWLHKGILNYLVILHDMIVELISLELFSLS